MPYIAVLSPSETSVSCQIITDSNSEVTAHYKKLEDKESFTMPVKGNKFTIDGLETRCDYEIFLTDADGRRGTTRWVRSGYYPGKVLDYLHFQDKTYYFSGRCLGSPSIVRLPSGAILAVHDIFCGGTGGTQENFAMVFRSDDDGESWTLVSQLFSCFWPRIFYLNGRTYIIACSRVYGDLLIGASDDEGVTWSTPTVLARSSCDNRAGNKGFHKGSCQPLISHGRIWFAIEYGNWSANIFCNTLLSAPVDSDLLDVEAWSFTEFCEPVRDNPYSLPGIPGAIEGVPVESPDGEYIYDLARYGVRLGESIGEIMRVKADDPEGKLEFYKFVKLPVGHSKFEVFKKDDGYAYVIGNRFPARTSIAVYRTKDYENWEEVKNLINFDGYSTDKVGLQYPSALFEGNKIYLLSRTAFNGSENFHDSNCITFHKFDF